MSTTSTPSADGTTEAPASACCDDPHDHTGHDHGPTGSEIVTGLVRGFSVLSLLVPLLGLVMVVAGLPMTPSTVLVPLLGIVLGGLQLGVIVATGLVVARGDRKLSVHPGLVVARSVLEEVLRVAAVLLVLIMWPAQARGPLGLWVGIGCALVWVVLTTAQLVSARRRIARPSEWSKEMVATLLLEKVSVRRTMLMRVLDVIGLMLFQVGATVLVTAAPVMAVATAVLSIAVGMSTLVQVRRTPHERTRSAWAFAPLAIGVITAALAVLASLSM